MPTVAVCAGDGSAPSPASVNTNAIKARMCKEMSKYGGGPRWATYWTALQRYVQSEMSIDALHSILHALLDPPLRVLHNELILAILHNAHLPHSTPPHSPTLHVPPTIDVAHVPSPEPNRPCMKRPLTDEEAVHTLLQLTTSDDGAADDVDDAVAFLKSFSMPHFPSKRSKPTPVASSTMPLLRPKPDPVMWSRHQADLHQKLYPSHTIKTAPLHQNTAANRRAQQEWELPPNIITKPSAKQMRGQARTTEKTQPRTRP